MATESILRNLFESKRSNISDELKTGLTDISFMKNFIRRHDSDAPISPEKSSWQTVNFQDHTCIIKEYAFNNHSNLLYFINEVLNLANRKDHHPTITINKDIVEISLYTHDMFDVTELDIRMSKEIEEIYEDVRFVDGLR